MHREKEEKSDVDKRELARYGALIKIPDIEQDYNGMTNVCKRAISQAEEIIFSNKDFNVPKELYE